MGTMKFIILSVITAAIASGLIIYSSGKVSVIEVPSIYSISGKVTGAPEVKVTLSGPITATTTTAKNGSYSFTGLANGNYIITPVLAGYAFSQISVIRSVSDADVTIPSITATSAEKTYSISGTTGLAGVTISLSSNDTTGSVLTGAGGTYTLAGLVPGSYTLIPSFSGYKFTPASLPVTITTTGPTAVNFTATAISG
jgi:hypothetical protein